MNFIREYVPYLPTPSECQRMSAEHQSRIILTDSHMSERIVGSSKLGRYLVLRDHERELEVLDAYAERMKWEKKATLGGYAREFDKQLAQLGGKPPFYNIEDSFFVEMLPDYSFISCDPGSYENMQYWDLSGAYFQLFLRLPSPKAEVHRTENGIWNITFYPCPVGLRAALHGLEALCMEQKLRSFRLIFIGMQLQQWRHAMEKHFATPHFLETRKFLHSVTNIHCWHNGTPIEMRGYFPGSFRVAALLSVRLLRDIMQEIYLNEDSPLILTDACVTKDAPLIWKQLGLLFKPKSDVGWALIVRPNLWKVASIATKGWDKFADLARHRGADRALQEFANGMYNYPIEPPILLETIYQYILTDPNPFHPQGSPPKKYTPSLIRIPVKGTPVEERIQLPNKWEFGTPRLIDLVWE